jgi:outer membrane protein
MTRLLLISALCILIILNVFLTIKVFNNDKPKIAFVKSSQLVAQYNGFLTATKSFQSKSAIWQANMDTLKKELQVEVAKFENSKPGLSQKEKELSLEVISGKQQQLRQYQEGIQQRAQQEDQVMTQQVLAEVNAFVNEYAKKNGYDLILGANESGNIVYAEDIYDITEDVLKELNKNHK